MIDIQRIAPALYSHGSYKQEGSSQREKLDMGGGKTYSESLNHIKHTFFKNMVLGQ